MATGNEAYWATYALCRPFPAKGVCYQRCRTLNRTLTQLNRLYIIPKHGEPRQASVVDLNSPSTQQTCRNRAGHSGIFFLFHKNRPNWTKAIPSERKGGSIGCSGSALGANGSKVHNAPPKLFLSTHASLFFFLRRPVRTKFWAGAPPNAKYIGWGYNIQEGR